MEKQTIAIGGMGCAACAQKVEKAIGNVEGVQSVLVDLAAGKADVSYDPAKANLSDIRAAVEKVGYAV